MFISVFFFYFIPYFTGRRPCWKKKSKFDQIVEILVFEKNDQISHVQQGEKIGQPSSKERERRGERGERELISIPNSNKEEKPKEKEKRKKQREKEKKKSTMEKLTSTITTATTSPMAKGYADTVLLMEGRLLKAAKRTMEDEVYRVEAESKERCAKLYHLVQRAEDSVRNYQTVKHGCLVALRLICDVIYIDFRINLAKSDEEYESDRIKALKELAKLPDCDFEGFPEEFKDLVIDTSLTRPDICRYINRRVKHGIAVGAYKKLLCPDESDPSVTLKEMEDKAKWEKAKEKEAEKEAKKREEDDDSGDDLDRPNQNKRPKL